MVRRCTSVFFLLATFIFADEQPATLSPRYGEVQVENTRTSIYVGHVSLSLTTFKREGISFHSTYSAKFFPYFFYNEKGRLAIDLTDDDLRRLEKGETVNFTGKAESNGGEPRRIEGRAVPADVTSGKIKVRVFVTQKIELIFNTTYRFTGK